MNRNGRQTLHNLEKSIENLQTALSMELTAIQQYLLHTHVFGDWGLDRLAERMREEMGEPTYMLAQMEDPQAA